MRGDGAVIRCTVVAAWHAGEVLAICSGPNTDRIRPSLDPAAWRWDRALAWRVRVERLHRNKERMQRLAFYSQSELRALRDLHRLDYEQGTGYLQLFRSNAEVERSSVTRRMLTDLGVAHALLTPEQAYAIEPALHVPTPLAGALHLPNDETGNCAFFAQQLKDIAIEDGVDFRFNVSVQGVRQEQQRVTRLQTDGGEIGGDAFVVAGGIDSLKLLRSTVARQVAETYPGFARKHWGA